jgi:hypothetical protein
MARRRIAFIGALHQPPATGRNAIALAEQLFRDLRDTGSKRNFRNSSLRGADAPNAISKCLQSSLYCHKTGSLAQPISHAALMQGALRKAVIELEERDGRAMIRRDELR